MANIKEINRVAHKYNIPLVFDVARWAENCYFIKMNEEGYADKSIAEIATEMFQYCDAFTMSAKKDGHANMGGMLAFRDKGLFWKNFSDFDENGNIITDVGVTLKVKQISCYGNDSYGGMSGRDIMALAVGLYAVSYTHLDVYKRQILYTLNAADNDKLIAAAGCFQDESTAGKIQFGSAWWFNDHFDGMTAQLKSLANIGVLSRFVGMLTDSRSFLSYPRHEYFRRVLCELVGGWIASGMAPADYDGIGKIIEDICFNNIWQRCV